MTRLIPGKTKVEVELFRGVTLGDVIVAGIGIGMLILLILSNLPHKFGFCVGMVAVTGLLLFRIDDQANYKYLLHILRYFGYDRRFARAYTDEMLVQWADGTIEDAALQELFPQKPEESESKEEKKTRQAAEKARKKEYAREEKRLKSKTTPEEEKEAIRARRARESADAMRRTADARDAAANRRSMDGIIGFTDIRDGLIEYNKGAYFGAAIEIDPVEFRFFSEHRRQNSIETGLGSILRSVNPKYSANIVKIDRPIRYESYLDKEYEKLYQLRDSYESGFLTEAELKARVEVEYDRITELQSLCNDNKVITGFYYIVLYESDKRQLELQVSNAISSLTQGEMVVRRLNDRELAVFLKYTNALDFDEHEIDKIRPKDYVQWAKPQVVDIKARRVEVNHIVTHNFRTVRYPSLVGDAWLAGVMSIPGTKVVVKAKPMDREKAVRGIDHALIELRGQWSATGIDSKRLEIEQHLNTLQELLGTLQADNESLLEVNVYVTAYDIVGTRNNYKIKQPGDSVLPTITDMKKTIRRVWQESGFRLSSMEFEQSQAFVASQVNGLDPMAREGRGIPSNTVAACYPWIFAHISDEGGVKLGSNDGIPVFINFFRRDSERVNSNMVIVGKSGSGKSYATKSILSNLAADDAKIFILDPENEYTELASNLHGKIINVGNAQFGRLNPFHIITALEDDEAGEGAASGSYATHLQFLEEFFRQIMPDCEKDAMEYLNTLVDRLYLDHDITPETNLSKLRPQDYPIFDDLYDEVLQEFQGTDNAFTRDMLRTLMNYIAKFSTGGRNANIWNGPSTVTTETNFTVFNFQSMLANRNQTIANAQMLLVLKYIDNEIIKNRDYNMKYGLHRKIVVVIDEAHVFIDAKYPIALDFMFQLAKRIRKYNGMQIVITQNIKDFVGSEEIARKSTAIINACQYSFIFALAPNDIQDLVKLYENAGGINESEQEQIVQAPRGQAFTIMSPTSRSIFRVESGEGMIHMFEDRDFNSQYFSGEDGAANWEDFVAGSREAHDKAILSRWEQVEDTEEDAPAAHSSVVFEEVSEEEPEAAPKKPGVVLFEEEDDLSEYGGITFKEIAVDPNAKTDQAAADMLRSPQPIETNPTVDAPAAKEPEKSEADASMGVVMEMLGTMTSKITEAFERVGIPVAPEPADASAASHSAVAARLAEKDAEISARDAVINAKDAELERMRLELEQLRQSLAQGTAQPEEGSAPVTDIGDEDKAWGEAEPEIYLEMDDASDGEDGAESGITESNDSWDDSDEAIDADAGIDAEDGLSGIFEEEADEDDAATTLAAFISLSVKRANSLDFVDRMRCDRQKTATITLAELNEYLEMRHKHRSEEE